MLNLILGRKTKIKVGNHLILFHLNWDQAQEIGKKLRSKSCSFAYLYQYAFAILDSFVSKYIVNFHLFIMCIDIYSPLSTCIKSKRCNKSSNHRGKCNSEKQSHKFWVNSTVYNLKASRAEVISQRTEIECWEANLNQADYKISSKRQELEELAKYTEEQASTAS